MEPDDLVFLSAEGIAERLGIDRSTLYRRIAAGRFPRPRDYGRKDPCWTLADFRHYLRFVDRWFPARQGEEPADDAENSPEERKSGKK